jgi:hypothetical protein
MSGINDSGQVAGGGGNSQGSDQAFITSVSGGAAIPLPNSDWVVSDGLAISNSGQVAGYAGGFAQTAMIGTPSGSTVIPSVSGMQLAAGEGVNDSGEVAGWGFLGTNERAFIGTASGSTAIPLLPGWTFSYGYGINVSGQVAGYGGPNSNTQAFIGTASGMTAIPLVSGWHFAEGFSINDSGQVAGWGFSGSRYQAFIGTTSGSTAIALPTGAAYAETNSSAGSLSNSGQVVGFSDVGGWIWDASNGTQLLNTIVPSGWNISNAVSISNDGQLILAYGSYDGGDEEFVELSAPNATATPEPGTILLACAGLLLVGIARMRYRGARA